MFYKDVPTITMFASGTTDLIIGTVVGNAVIGNEFVSRGEFPGAPDGCAMDFETNATATVVSDNYISHSYGAGIMVFGHAPGSNLGLLLHRNTFVEDGCLQTRGDSGAIAFVRPGSEGLLRSNMYISCSNNSIPVYHDVEPNASALWHKTNETILPPNRWPSTSPPMLTVLPSKPACFTVQLDGTAPAQIGVVRYSINAWAPNSSSPILALGQQLHLCRSTAVSAKRFGVGGFSSITASVFVDVEKTE